MIDDQLALVYRGLDQSHARQLADNEDTRHIGFEVLAHRRHAHGLEHATNRQRDCLRRTNLGAFGMSSAALGVRQNRLSGFQLQRACLGTHVHATAAANAQRRIDDGLSSARLVSRLCPVIAPRRRAPST